MNNSEFYVSTTFAGDSIKLSSLFFELQGLGITNLELGSTHAHENWDDFTSLFRKANTLVHNYFPIPKESFVLNIASACKEIRTRSVEHVFDALKFCSETESLLYTFHPGFLSDPAGASKSNANYDFKWDNSKISKDLKHYEECFERMLESIDLILSRSLNLGVPIAIETEGSFRRPDHLLMQRPEEYERFLKSFGGKTVGINLNLGHLPLASKVFGFKVSNFVDLISDEIVAMEMSHNDGIDDQHLPLLEFGWYWDVIFDPRFDHVKKILEFRETSLDEVFANLELCRRKQVSKN
jgi:sugar phosphate isomerase/epimerase